MSAATKIAASTLALAAALIVLSMPAAAGASTAGSWLTPTAVESSEVDPGASASAVAFDAGGDAYAAWVRDEGGEEANNYDPTHFGIVFARHPAGGSWSAPEVVAQIPTEYSGYEGAVQLAVDEAGDAVVAWTTVAIANEYRTLYVAERSASASEWTVDPSPISGEVSSSETGGFDLAIDGAGDATIAFASANGNEPGVYAVRRPAGGAWEAAPTLLDADVDTKAAPSLAVDGAGDALIAYNADAGGSDEARTVSRAADDASWSTPQTLVSFGASDECFRGLVPLTHVAAALSSSGRAVVSWTNSCHASSENAYAGLDQVTVREGGSWGTPSTVATVTFGYGRPATVAIDAAGEATLVWEGGEVPYDLDSSDLPAGSSAWGEPETVVSDPNELSGPLTVAADARGDLVLGQRDLGSGGESDHIDIAYRAAGGIWLTSSFAAPAPPGYGGTVGVPALAISPQGVSVALWVQTNGQTFGAGGPWDYEEEATAFDTGPSLSSVQIPEEGYAEQQLEFSATAGGDFSPLNDVKWEFGDGQTADGASVTHVYEEEGEYDVTVTATDEAGNETTSTGTVRILEDAEPPTISISTPGEGEQLVQGQVAYASYSCEDPGSGVASCAGPIADGAQIDTSQAGSFSFEVDATDNAGNSNMLTHDYVVVAPTKPTVSTGMASGISGTAATLAGSVNPNGSEVSSCELQYGTSTSYGSVAACSPAPGSGQAAVAVSAAIDGLTPGTTYHFRVVATNAGGTGEGQDETFTTLAEPTVVTGTASALSETAATVGGTVDPHDSDLSSCKFEYDTTGLYQSAASVPCSSLPKAGSGQASVSATLGGLDPGTTYHFRIVATNGGGTSYGNDATFTTLAAPSVATGTASGISDTAATLSGTVDPHDSDVSACQFDYGPTSGYGSHVSCSSLPKAGSGLVPVSATLDGLDPGATYHFRVEATNAAGTRYGGDETFTTHSAPGPVSPTAATGSASLVSGTAATLNATVDPNGSEVSACELEYGTSASYGSTAACSPAPGSGQGAVAVSATISGLTPGTAYHFRVVATNAGGTSRGSDATFTTLAPPTAITGAASAVSASGASLSASVDPNGSEVTDCELQYGTSAGYGASVPCSPMPGSGSAAVLVAAALSGLAPGTTYHFRVVATNAAGTAAGADATFTTPAAPAVATGSASAISQTAAALSGTVDPRGLTVSACEFQYGTTSGYGASVPCAVSPGSGEGAVAVSTQLSGLVPGTTYHFRVLATNAAGTAAGADASFATPSAPPPIKTIDTTTDGKMPSVVKQQLDDARTAVLHAGISADFQIVQRHLKDPPRGVLPGDVFEQSPDPGTALTSGVGQHPVVKLAVYSGPKGPCPEHAIANGIEGMQLDAALKVLKAESCKVEYDLHSSNHVSVPTLGSAKPGAEAHSVLVKVLVSDDPTKNDLHIAVFPVYSRASMTFTLNSWQLTAGEWNTFEIHVLPPNTGPENDGIELEGARVFVDTGAVGGEEGRIDRTTDKSGNAQINLKPHDGGLVQIAVMWTGANGVSVYGVAEVQVKDRSGQPKGAELPLQDGTVWEKGKQGWHMTFKTTAATAQTTAVIARSSSPFVAWLEGWGEFFKLSKGGSGDAQQVSNLVQSHDAVGEVQAGKQPIGKADGPATPQTGPIVTNSSFGTAGAGKQALIALPEMHVVQKGGEVIAAGAGNVIAAGAGNVIAAGAGNVIPAGGGNILVGHANGVIAAGGGNVIAAGGGNVIAAGGGNVIAAGAGN